MRPWAMDFLPGSGVRLTNMALVTEKGGRLWLVDVDSGRKQQVAAFPASRSRGRAGSATSSSTPISPATSGSI